MFFIIGLAHREQGSSDGNPQTPAQMKYGAALEALINRVAPGLPGNLYQRDC